jgi:hypothetical protein
MDEYIEKLIEMVQQAADDETTTACVSVVFLRELLNKMIEESKGAVSPLDDMFDI